MNRRVVVAGNLSLDDTVTPTDVHPNAPGGDALYASLAVARWGDRPMLLTLVGEDYPAAQLARIAAAGVDTTSVRAVPGPTVHYRVTYAADGGRTFEWLGPEERLLLTSPGERDYAALGGAAWLHLAAMPMAAHEVGVAAARRAGVNVSVDPHEEYVVGFEDRLRAIVAGAVFLPSELEARLLFPDLAHLVGVDFGFAAAERLDAWAPAVVAVKQGPLGSVVRVARRSSHVPAQPNLSVVDPTGAGDAYCGGFVVGWLRTGDPIVAAACGTVAAAETIGTFGAFSAAPLPSTEERLRTLDAVIAGVGDTPARVAAQQAVAAIHADLRSPLGAAAAGVANR